MDVGIGLPNALDGVRGRHLIDWSEAAEQRGFSVLGTIGRIVFDTHEELIAFAAAAAVTERIGLMSSVMIAPPRQSALLAKQAATLDHLSQGRFRLGIGTGWRRDDYAVMGAGFDDRGRLLDAQLDALRRTWHRQPLDGAQDPVGPAPFTDGGPPIVLGGGGVRALERVGRRADAYLAPPAPADQVAKLYARVREAAEAADRPAPRLLAARYFALGEVDEEVRHNVTSYYSFGGPDFVEQTYDSVLRTPGAVTEALRSYADVGVEELCLWPVAAGHDQLHALADAVL